MRSHGAESSLHNVLTILKKPTVHSGAFEFKDGKWQKQEIDPGKYELKEETLNGYAFESLVCKDAKKPEKSAESPIELVTAGDKHFIDLKPGQDVECTFTNKQIPGEITWERLMPKPKRNFLKAPNGRLFVKVAQTKTRSPSSKIAKKIPKKPTESST